MQDPARLQGAVAEDPGRDAEVGPQPASAVEVVNSFMFEASGAALCAARWQMTWPVWASSTIRPLACPPPRTSRPFSAWQSCPEEAALAAARAARVRSRAARSAARRRLIP